MEDFLDCVLVVYVSIFCVFLVSGFGVIMSDAYEMTLVDACPSPERDALRAVYAFLQELEFDVGWIVWAEKFVVRIWDVDRMFWMQFDDPGLCMWGPAWIGMIYHTDDLGEMAGSLKRRVFELSDPDCFDQVVRSLC